jgi:hypothetical protein
MEHESRNTDPRDIISRNLTEFLRRTVKPGQEAEVAINTERERVIVFIDGDPVLNCSFTELMTGPGASLN